MYDKLYEAIRSLNEPNKVMLIRQYFIIEKASAIADKMSLSVKFVPEKPNCIDIGIALWHIAIESEGFQFSIEQNSPERKGFIYAGTVAD